MNADKLSTGGASPSAESKKREGEKRKSPLTPYREKGKEKGKRENLRATSDLARLTIFVGGHGNDSGYALRRSSRRAKATASARVATPRRE